MVVSSKVKPLTIWPQALASSLLLAASHMRDFGKRTYSMEKAFRQFPLARLTKVASPKASDMAMACISGPMALSI
jgi:hypothetical protein